MAINWEEAPEGTTHAINRRDGTVSWRIINHEERSVEMFDGNEWVPRTIFNFDEYLRINHELLIERPAPQEVELPNGLKWPEDKSFRWFNVAAGIGFFFNETHFVLEHNFDGVASPLSDLGFHYWSKNEGTIHRYGGKPAQAVAKKVETPKKKVGWW